MYYNNKECIAYKDVIIDGEKYTVIIKDATPNSITEIRGGVYVSTIDLSYHCELLNDKKDVIFHKEKNCRKHNGYVDIIKSFCEDYKKHKAIMNKAIEEEKLILKELEEWDGIIK